MQFVSSDRGNKCLRERRVGVNELDSVLSDDLHDLVLEWPAGVTLSDRDPSNAIESTPSLLALGPARFQQENDQSEGHVNQLVNPGSVRL